MSDVSLKMILWSAIRKSVKRGYSAATHSARPRDPKNVAPQKGGKNGSIPSISDAARPMIPYPKSA